jgi:hypothetical protein
MNTHAQVLATQKAMPARRMTRRRLTVVALAGPNDESAT